MLIALGLSLLINCIATACVEFIDKQGSVRILSYKLFSNDSLAVLDVTSTFTIFSPAGVVIHREKLELPLDLMSGEPVPIAAAIIMPSVIHFFAFDSLAYAYFEGVAYPLYVFASGTMARNTIFGTSALDEMFIRFVEGGFEVFQIQNNVLSVDPDDQGVLDGFNDLYEPYIERISTNRHSNEIFITTLSTKIYSFELRLEIKSSTSEYMYKVYPAANDVIANTINETGLYMVSSSVGGNSNLIAYAGLALSGDSSIYRHLLVVRGRTAPGSPQVQELVGFHVHSVAVHPTLNRLFLYTTRGALYLQDLTAGSAPQFVGSPVLVAGSLFHKYADLEVLDGSRLLLRTSYALATYDFAAPGPALAAVFLNKPSFGRRLHGSDKLLLVFHNQFVQLFDTRSHQLDLAAGFPALLGLREVLCHPAKPLLYLLFEDRVVLRAAAAPFPELQSKNKPQLAAMAAAAVDSLQDLEVLKNSPMLCLLVYRADRRTQLLLMHDESLTLIASYIVPTDILYYTLRSFPYHLAGFETFSLNGVDVNFVIKFRSDTGAFFDNYTEIIQSNTIFGVEPLKTQVKRIIIDHLFKTTPIFISQSEISYGFTSNRFFIASTYKNTADGDIFVYSEVLKTSALALTNLNGNMTINYSGWILDGNLMILRLRDPYPSILWNYFLVAGVTYQSPDDDRIYVTGGSEFVQRISMTDCYQPLMIGDTQVLMACKVLNCFSCNVMNSSQCKICYPGYTLLSEGKYCDNGTCASRNEYRLGAACVTHCGVDHSMVNSRSSGSDNLCMQEADCLSAYPATRLIGAYCIDSSCPVGSALAGRRCVPALGTEAFYWKKLDKVGAKCNSTTDYWVHFSTCVSFLKDLPTSNYHRYNNIVYCDPSTHFFDIDENRCVQSCSKYQGYSAMFNKYCISKAGCTDTKLFIYADDIAIPKQCVESCFPVRWTDLSLRSCEDLCLAPKFKIAGNMTCVSSCGQGFFTNRMLGSCEVDCRTTPQRWTNKANSSCELACRSDQFVNDSSETCLDSCPAPLWADTVTRRCVDTCDKSLFLVSFNRTCLSRCPESFWLRIDTRECFSACPADTVSILEDRSCAAVCKDGEMRLSSNSTCISREVCLNTLGFKIVVTGQVCRAACPTQTFLLKSNASCLQDSQCKSLYQGGDGGLISLSDKTCLPECRADQYLLISQLKCVSLQESPGPGIEIVLSASRTAGFVQEVSPALGTSPLGTLLGPLLFITAQSYSKLRMIPHLNFELGDTLYSDYYYLIFQTFIDGLNEKFTSKVFGAKNIAENREYVCESGFKKLCFLRNTDNFVVSQLLSILIFCCQIAVLLAASLVAKSLSYPQIASDIIRRIKTVSWISFCLQKSIEFWKSLLINAMVTKMRIPLFAVLKVVGHALLGFMLVTVFCCMAAVKRVQKKNEHAKTEAKSKTQSSSCLIGLGIYLLETIDNVTRSMVKPAFRYSYIIVSMLHDLGYSIILIPFAKLGVGQLYAFLLFEVVFIILLFKFQVYSSRLQAIRQYLVQSIYLMIAGLLCAQSLKAVDDKSCMILLLILSLTVIFVDIVYLLCKFLLGMVTGMKHLVQKKKVMIKSIRVERKAQLAKPSAQKRPRQLEEPGTDRMKILQMKPQEINTTKQAQQI